MASAPIEGTDELREAILRDLAGWIDGQTEAATESPAVRAVVIRRVCDDLADVFQMGGAVKGDAARDVASQARVFLRRPLSQAGLGESLRSMVVAGKRTALRRLGAPEALADLADASSALSAVSSLVDMIVEGREQEQAVPTGLRTLDGPLNGGLPRGELTLLGAGTGDGKTAIALQIAGHAASQDRGMVLVASPEMSARSLWLRQAQRSAQVPRRELRPGHPAHEGASSAVLAAASRESQRSNFVLLDRVDADIASATSTARILHEQRGPLYLVVLDYAQQLAPDEDQRPRYQIVGQVAREAVKLAMDTGAAVLLTSQINVARDKNGKVVDISYRESQTVEHKSAVALILTPDKPKQRARIQIRKHREGPQLSIELYYRPELFLFADLEQEEGERAW